MVTINTWFLYRFGNFCSFSRLQEKDLVSKVVNDEAIADNAKFFKNEDKVVTRAKAEARFHQAFRKAWGTIRYDTG